MSLITFIFDLLARTFSTFGHIGSAIVDTAAVQMREPLQHFGVQSVAQTLILACVPLLTMIASMKLLDGIVRFVLVLGMLGALLRITWPLVGQVAALV